MLTTIEVGDREIDAGVGHDCSRCAVTLGIRKEVKDGVYVATSHTTAYVGTLDLPLPGIASHFVDTFDNYKDGDGPRPAPITFDIDLPAEVLRG